MNFGRTPFMPRSADGGASVRIACAVAYRVRDGRMEFCLVSPAGTTRWEFPQTKIRQKETALKAALRAAKTTTGIVCRHADRQPLDQFGGTKKKGNTQLMAYLLTAVKEPSATSRRRSRWCFAEEARARIRRKPMRRLIDLAISRV